MPYKHVFFDLDHTLWDFEKNCAESLAELYDRFGLSGLPFSKKQLIETYNQINHAMWYEYNRGRMSKEDIRRTRFERTFEALGADKSLVPREMNEAFLELCPTKGNVMPFAHEVLGILYEKYTLHIITNGFKDTQGIKIATSNLDKYFSEIILSEMCGFSKPHIRIFEFALMKANTIAAESVMIGDDLYTDIEGALNAGMDCIYYNPKEEKHEGNPTYEINCLTKLKQIL